MASYFPGQPPTHLGAYLEEAAAPERNLGSIRNPWDLSESLQWSSTPIKILVRSVGRLYILQSELYIASVPTTVAGTMKASCIPLVALYLAFALSGSSRSLVLWISGTAPR